MIMKPSIPIHIHYLDTPSPILSSVNSSRRNSRSTSKRTLHVRCSTGVERWRNRRAGVARRCRSRRDNARRRARSHSRRGSNSGRRGVTNSRGGVRRRGSGGFRVADVVAANRGEGDGVAGCGALLDDSAGDGCFSVSSWSFGIGGWRIAYRTAQPRYRPSPRRE